LKLEVLSDFTDKALERELADEQVGGLLITPDTKRELVGLLSRGSLKLSNEYKCWRFSWRPWWRVAYEGLCLKKRKTNMVSTKRMPG